MAFVLPEPWGIWHKSSKNRNTLWGCTDDNPPISILLSTLPGSGFFPFFLFCFSLNWYLFCLPLPGKGMCRKLWDLAKMERRRPGSLGKHHRHLTGGFSSGFPIAAQRKTRDALLAFAHPEKLDASPANSGGNKVPQLGTPARKNLANWGQENESCIQRPFWLRQTALPVAGK